IAPADWARFQYYVKRVREFKSTKSIQQMHQSAWLLAEILLRGKPLLPNLRRLEMTVAVKEPAGHLLFLSSSPALRILSVKFSHVSNESSDRFELVPEAAGLLLPLIMSKIPDLITLSLETGHHVLTTNHLRSLEGLPRLQSLDLIATAEMNLAALQVLSRLPALRTLNVTARFSSASKKPPVPAAGNFALLRQLTLQGRLSDIVSFFHAFTFDALDESLGLNISDAATDIAIKEKLAVIMPKVPRKIRGFSLLFQSLKFSTGSGLSLSTVFESCLDFGDVIDVAFGFASPLRQFADDDLLRFAKAWPKLQSLRLNDIVGRYNAEGDTTASQITLEGLASISEHCPHLSTLEIPVLDATSVLPISSFPTIGHKNMRDILITELHNGATANLLDIALILDRLFPLLDTKRRICIRNRNSRPSLRQSSLKDPWGLTQALLAAVQAGRE
ncbi:hypothetical protein FKP32DRAFT_1552595, partial [Trametes sanguinea]